MMVPSLKISPAVSIAEPFAAAESRRVEEGRVFRLSTKLLDARRLVDFLEGMEVPRNLCRGRQQISLQAFFLGCQLP